MKIFEKIKLFLSEISSKGWLIIAALAVVFAGIISARVVMKRRGGKRK